jgi:hypothetical protein
MIKMKKWKKFWGVFEKNGKDLTTEFKHLIERFLSVDPSERPDLEEIYN